MTIKALLLGSAAALVAVSGARAADAVVIPEPEAVEYVRVCDAAGAGYFYIPGGETCLKIGGYVQFEVKTVKGNGNIVPATAGLANDHFDYSTESVLEVSSWTDSEFGAVKTYIKIQGGDGYAIKMDRATLSIGGLTMGWTNTFYDFNESGAADALFAAGPDEANQITYVANFSGGSFGIQLVDDYVVTAPSNYVPDVLAMVTFSAGVDVTAAVSYDETASAWGFKTSAAYAGFGATVQYSSDADTATGAALGSYSAENQWVIGANYGFDATDKLNLNLGVAYGFSDANSADDWAVGVEAAYMLTDTFKVSARARAMDNSLWDARVRFKASF